MQDYELLRQYVDCGCEGSFRQLVERHADAVYASARRQVGDPQLAEDVTQAVFIVLAKKARQLDGRGPLGGWLMKTTFLAARDARKMELRRRRHEGRGAAVKGEVAMIGGGNRSAQSEVVEELDRAMAKLSDADRTAITLRYLQERSLEEVGATCGVSAEAAGKRVARAMERLRRIFVQTGKVPWTSSLILGLRMQRRVTAPAHLPGAAVEAATGPADNGSRAGRIAQSVEGKTMRSQLIVAALIAALFMIGAGKGDARSAVERGTDRGFSVVPARVIGHLRSGIAVELVGVCMVAPQQGNWWGADGSWVTGPPTNELPPVAPLFSHRSRFPYLETGPKSETEVPADQGPTPDDIAADKARRIFLRGIAVGISRASTREAAEASISWKIIDMYRQIGAHRDASGADGALVPERTYLDQRVVGVVESGGGATLRARVATGPWNRIASGSIRQVLGAVESMRIVPGAPIYRVHGITRTAGGKSPQTEFEIGTHWPMAVRISAEDIAGHRYVGYSEADPANVCTLPVALSSLKSVQIDSRPYDQWIEIRHISWRGGQRTRVEIMTSDMTKKEPPPIVPEEVIDEITNWFWRTVGGFGILP